jgi:hypothetical protein
MVLVYGIIKAIIGFHGVVGMLIVFLIAIQTTIIYGKMVMGKCTIKMDVLYGGMAIKVLNFLLSKIINFFLKAFFYLLDHVKTTATTGCSMTAGDVPLSWECKWNFEIVE